MTLGAAVNLRNISGTLGAARRQLAMTRAKGTCRLSHAFPRGAAAEMSRRRRGEAAGCGTRKGRALTRRAWRAPSGRACATAWKREVGEMLTMGYAAAFRVELALKSLGEAVLWRSLLRNPFMRCACGDESIRHPYKKTHKADSFIEPKSRTPSIVMFDTNGSRHQ
ncbi:hypothetical protein [Paraburkholderia sp. CNPSo 3281]|uniref:hypothetical protein n=1 Tax=Paraburkholderia sp. CNPSo 3281 TaxID=2940933 RepID=UPI0020B76918|nr:hypothetical protein [Paraburkholderia sp. CNPSo 3281]MCP3716676.1 hypothetical protein [Paraburkholderia sp. CNPSo 3281]